MPDVEIGVGAADPQIGKIANQAPGHRVYDARLIIDGMREGVVKIKLEICRKPPAQSKQHAVVTGGSVVVYEHVGGELPAHSHIRIEKTISIQPLECVGQISAINQDTTVVAY